MIGQTIDRYQILDQLGQGGMATVYLANDPRLDRKVAVKVIRRDTFPPVILDKILKRFEREARALARLNHPNIVAIIDYGSHQGSPYLVMPYIPSGTLKEKLGKPIHYAEAAHILAPIARALAYAHSEEIIHRDVKPSNILITRSGEPVLTDFGIAKILEEVDGNTLTSTGMGLGTPEYMAPEQWYGKADASSDQYALGVIFYEMVTGQKPYTADTPPAVMLKQATEPLPKPHLFIPELPEEVEQTILKILDKEPVNRYDHMTTLVKTFEKFTRDLKKDFENSLTEIFVPDRPDQEKMNSLINDQNSKAIDCTDFVKAESAFNWQPDLDTYYDNVPATEGHEPGTVPTFESDLGQKPLSSETLYEKDNNKRLIGKLQLPVKPIFILVGVVAVYILVMFLINNFRNQSFFPSPSETLKPTSISTTEVKKVVATVQITSSTTPTSTITIEPAFAITATPTLGVGSVIINDIDGMEMVYVPEGEFEMGCDSKNNGEFECESTELPLHTVYLDAFFIDKFEVTNQQYEKCVNAGFCSPPTSNLLSSGSSSYSDPKFADYPVTTINWYSAKGYCEWAGKRLPTEAEWEKAAKGMDTDPYPWGNRKPTCLITNGNLSDGCVDDVNAVGSYPDGVSYYGVHDMSGNVTEFISDWYQDGYYSSSPVENPLGPEHARDKVVRGGSWRIDAAGLRIVKRMSIDIAWRWSHDIGFRCVKPYSSYQIEQIEKNKTPVPTPENQITKISEIDGMEMIYIPEGNFLMGSNDPQAYENEKPPHEVYLDAYWVDKFEVTNDQYRLCVDSGVCPEPENNTFFNDEDYNDYPIMDIYWWDAIKYCDWAGRRLPTEAEWEKAARGPDGRKFPWGDDVPTDELVGGIGMYRRPEKVGSYPLAASYYGVLDMASNVWEWVNDWYDQNYYSSQTSWNNPQGPTSGTYKVLKGGSSWNNERRLRSSVRSEGGLDFSFDKFGFRCVMDAED